MENQLTVSDNNKQYQRAKKLLFSFLQRSNWRPQITETLPAMRFGFVRMKALMKILGNPQNETKFVHVGGTSGKGSVAHMIYDGLRASGHSTALYTNPFITTPLEEVAANGQLVDPGDYVKAFNKVVEAAETLYEESPYGLPTYLEVKAATAFALIQKAAVDWAVIEVGSGGRFDKTNIIKPEVSVVTNVSNDHLQRLGPELSDVAWHQAGIIKPDTPVVCGVEAPELKAVLETEAEKKDAQMSFVSTSSGEGSYYDTNRDTAKAVFKILSNESAANINVESAARAIEKTCIPGRFEIVLDDPLVILDAAHNPPKIEALSRTVTKLYPDKPIILVFGLIKRKDVRGMVSELPSQVDEVFITSPIVEGLKTASPKEINRELIKNGFSKSSFHLEPQVAFEKAKVRAEKLDDALVLATGSLFLVGNIREQYWPEAKILRMRKNS